MKKFIALLALLGILFGFSACGSRDPDFVEREKQSKADALKETLEKKNLRAKMKLEEDPNRIGYLYVISFGKPFGYYVVKGKISSSGSQLNPQDELIQPWSDLRERYVVDGPQDDGTYGDGDPGVFFFTAEGVYVETSLDTVYSTAPIPSSLGIPKLG